MSRPSKTITTIYRVRSGDTLSHIAIRNQLSVAELLALNPQIDNPDRIVIDQPINVPSRSANPMASAEDIRCELSNDTDTEVSREANPEANPIANSETNPITNPETNTEGEITTGTDVEADGAKPSPVSVDALPAEQSQWPRWYQLARQECEQCTQEIAGEEHNPRIVAYHQCTTLAATDDETPWCSSFVNWCIQTAGVGATRSAAARSWLQWGEALSQPKEGCIVVLKRGTKPWQGHVGFYVKEKDDQICVLGGNQRNCVCESWYPKQDVLSYRSIAVGNDAAKKSTEAV